MRHARAQRSCPMSFPKGTIKIGLAAETSTDTAEKLSPQLAMVLAGFSFDAYNEVDRCAGIWISDGSGASPGINGVRTVLLSPQFVRESCRGILRVRVLSAEGLQNVPFAGTVGIAFRVAAGNSPWAFRSSDRCDARRGVFGSALDWREKDESVYLYVPRCSVGSPVDAVVLGVEVQVRDIFDSKRIGVCGRGTIPFRSWSSGKLCEISLQLELADIENQPAEDIPAPSISLQLYYDEFVNVTAGSKEIVPEVLDLVEDVTPENRWLRRRWGSAIPTEEMPRAEILNEQQLRSSLRRRALPCVGETREVLIKRLNAAMEADHKLRRAGSLWRTFEGVWGSDARRSLEGTLGAATSVAETLQGDFVGALGTGFAAGAAAIPGVDQLLRGDISGAFEARMKVVEAAATEEGRCALRRRVSVATKKARQQAMLRLANGMELMSVRKGAWKMLEQAIADESNGAESFSDYEQLAYLEAPDTNTECYVWRLMTHRRLVVNFRGTSDFGDVLTDLAVQTQDLGDLGCVHGGFWKAHESIRAAVKVALAIGCNSDAKGWEVLFTGHSLGGALAVLASLDIARVIAEDAESPLQGLRIRTCTFGSPRVGDARFCTLYDEYVPKCWRIYSRFDVVPRTPPISLFNFDHVGVAVELDPDNRELLVRGRSSHGRVVPAAGFVSESPGDVWKAFNADELAELQRVLGSGIQAVGEHMEENYFCRIQECLSAEVSTETWPDASGA